jgi:soluble lytic murein transglycosylase
MGIKEKIYKATSLLVLGVSCVAFQNWNYIDLKEATIGPVNEHARLAHAKELLGKKFEDGYGIRIEGIKDLNQQILDKMTARLPKPYKKMAPQLTQTLIEEAEANNLDPIFILAIIATESKFNPKARGLFGEIGLMQIKPDTAQWIARKSLLNYKGPKTLENPVQNVKLGVAYVAFLRNSFKCAPAKYLTAYNMGPHNVRRMIAANIKPKEYASRVMSNYRDLYAELSSSSRKSELQASL